MRLVVTSLLFLLMSSCASHEKRSELIGVWKSNEQKTLESMETVPGISPKAKELFQSDFFGHLVVEYRHGKSRTYFDKESHSVEEMMDFSPYQLLEETEGYFLLKSDGGIEGEVVETKLLREGNCYYLMVPKWAFREYFCKVK